MAEASRPSFDEALTKAAELLRNAEIEAVLAEHLEDA